MISKRDLAVLEHTSIKEIDLAALTDLQETTIQGETAPERFESFLAQVNNPYCFRVGKTPVKVSFCPQGDELHQTIEKILISLKNM